jgi:hypothetical protein
VIHTLTVNDHDSPTADGHSFSDTQAIPAIGGEVSDP